MKTNLKERMARKLAQFTTEVASSMKKDIKSWVAITQLVSHYLELFADASEAGREVTDPMPWYKKLSVYIPYSRANQAATMKAMEILVKKPSIARIREFWGVDVSDILYAIPSRTWSKGQMNTEEMQKAIKDFSEKVMEQYPSLDDVLTHAYDKVGTVRRFSTLN